MLYGLRAFVLLLIYTGAQAAATVEEMTFERVSAERLGANFVLLCGHQDDLGQMWLGTADGLIRYDGRRGQVYGADPQDPHALSHRRVQDVAGLAGGELLVATAAGVDRFDPRSGRSQHLPLPGQRTAYDQAVLKLAAARGAAWWVLGRSELFQLDLATRQFTAVALPDLRPMAPASRVLMRGLQPDGEGGVWLVAGAELLRVDASGRPQARWPLPPFDKPGGGVRALTLDHEGRAWIGRNDRLVVLDTRTGQRLDLPERLGLPPDTVHTVMRDADNGLWIGYGQEGLWHVPAGADKARSFRRHPGLPNSLPHDTVSALLQDRSGTLWVGSWKGGIALADAGLSGFRSFHALQPEGKVSSGDVVRSVQPDDDEHVWVGTYGQGLLRLNLRTAEAERTLGSDPAVAFINVLLAEADGQLWIGTDRGLFAMDTRRRRLTPVNLGERVGGGKVVTAISRGPGGELWVGTVGGIAVLDPEGTVRRHRKGADNGLLNDAILALLQDRQGRLWVGSEGGLQLWQGQGFIVPGGAPGPVGQVRALREGPDGRLWVGASTGLISIDPAASGWRWQSWSGSADLPRRPIWDVIIDADGLVWITSERGLSTLDPATRSVRTFGSDSHPVLEDYAPASASRGRDASLFFGGLGLLQVQPGRIHASPAGPTVLLSDIRVFNHSLRDEPQAVDADGPARSLPALGVEGPLERAGAVRLSHREAMVSFDLRAQRFRTPQRLRYAWRLEGFDRDWVVGRPGEGLATYTNLDAGSFRLMAKAADADGVWGEPRQLLTVEVQPPWWRSSAFRMSAGALLLAGGALAWRLRWRRLELAQRQLAQEVERRTAQVQAQRQQIATLSDIGREITASLDLQAIRATLAGHVARLMPATAFGVGLVLPDEQVLALALLDANGQPRPEERFSLGDRDAEPVRCLLHGEPVLRPQALYVPLQLKGQVHGVLVAQAEDVPAGEAFTTTHRDMLQTLAAYAAVALDNAEAYHQLQRAQLQLAEQRKMAALGHLVAGVAHEMNTPIGNGLLAASTLQEASQQLSRQVAQGQVRRSDLNQFLVALDAGCALVLRNLQSAGRLVSAFRQLAVDRQHEPRDRFMLRALVNEVLASHARNAAAQGVALQCEASTDIELDSYPAPLHQVLTQLVDNALEHGLLPGQGGRLWVSIEPVGADQVRLRVADDGAGIAPEHLGRVFDPFYTTRFGRGTNGLGLHLCYVLVTSLLGGQLTVRSSPGQGAVFEIMLPRIAPGADEAAPGPTS